MTISTIRKTIDEKKHGQPESNSAGGITENKTLSN